MTARTKDRTTFFWIGAVAGAVTLAGITLTPMITGDTPDTAPQELVLVKREISFKAAFPEVVSWTPAKNRLTIRTKFPDTGEICVINNDTAWGTHTYCFSGRDLRTIARQMQKNINSLNLGGLQGKVVTK